MARKLRLEFPGACYHVINRGNYRADVFRTDRTKAAFMACLFEACRRSDWVLHAFVVMRNHYHLALETPGGNLVAGMQWLQSTFANRFNRLRGERGHLFQGRYKALLVEPGDALGQVCHYLHLNPVRAGVVTVARLGDYRCSSYWYLLHPKARPAFLQLNTALREPCLLPDEAAGWKFYADYLDLQVGTGPVGESAAQVRLSQGWVLGSRAFKAEVLQNHQVWAESRAWEKVGAEEIRQERARQALQAGLQARGKTAADLASDRKGAPWKVALAAELKQATLVRNAWLAQHLHMGRPATVSSHVAKYLRLLPQ